MTTNTATRGTKRKVALAAGALVLAGVGGTLASGAWFTDQQKMTGNEMSAATIAISAAERSGNASLEMKNLMPTADASKGGIESDLKIVNTGDAPVRWAFAIDPKASSPGFLDAALIQFRVGDQGAWSEPTSFTSASQTLQKGPTSLVPNEAADVTVRAWLPVATSNSLQGATATFDVVVKAVQSDAPDATFDDDTQFPTR